MSQGKIKKIVSDKGFGFIESDGASLFFHSSEVRGIPFDNLREGQEVEFQEARGQKGPCATGVRLIGQN